MNDDQATVKNTPIPPGGGSYVHDESSGELTKQAGTAPSKAVPSADPARTTEPGDSAAAH